MVRDDGGGGRSGAAWRSRAVTLVVLALAACNERKPGGEGEQQWPVAPMTAGVLLKKAAPALPEDLWERQVAVREAGDDWLVYGGNLQSWRYSSLGEITKENVKKLTVAWKLETGLFDAFEASPIVVNGVMYLTTPWDHVLAVNARTGELFWRYVHPLPKSLPLCCGPVNRGVAVGHGKVFFATLDAHVVALDARTGEKVWESESASYEDGYSYTTAPQVVKDKVIVGISGSDFGVRAFIDAFDAGDGSLAWRFYVVPGPGEPGHETWGGGDAWRNGGGSPWMPITYDPKTNLVFAGTGNPGPDLDGSTRPGDNLHTESTVALDADSGKLRWYFQILPHDVWDYDNVTETVIDDVTIDGKARRVGMVASKNGFFYVLDITSGECLYALQYVHRVNWGKVDEKCRAIHDTRMYPVQDRWTVLYPGASGGKEWVPVAYDPERKRIFVPVIEVPHQHRLIPQKFHPGLNFWGGASLTVPGEGYGHLAAIDVEKKALAWDKRTEYPMVAGVAATATGLVITGTPDQKMQIYDADDGSVLFEYVAPSGWHSAPVTYAVDGKQYIAFPNGWGGWVSGFDDLGTPELTRLPPDNALYVFSL